MNNSKSKTIGPATIGGFIVLAVFLITFGILWAVNKENSNGLTRQQFQLISDNTEIKPVKITRELSPFAGGEIYVKVADDLSLNVLVLDEGRYIPTQLPARTAINTGATPVLVTEICDVIPKDAKVRTLMDLTRTSDALEEKVKACRLLLKGGYIQVPAGSVG